ncbi:hypothetical protein GCM10023194_57100 [Planotetraspora phitsanulokensis]|uniref:Lipoprotein n=1 Tax=Planotetraspora phitsanulokensis TaxID=575192 RepID=A0A8J3UDW2_9ACTN|nr:hypothetical protein [Planotetraspora phitsanulokensis]GII43067.1 hypothetical protein Pph01_80700 [Planotetraspora phitsanulokensis]
MPAYVSRVRFVAAAVAAVALLAGCSSGEAPMQRSAATSGNLASTPEAAPASPPLTETSTSSALPKAANGTDLAVCKDADCEVEVRPGDRLKIDAKFGLDAITVKSLGREEIRLALKGSSGGLRAEGRNVSVTGTCTNGRCHDEGELTLTTDKPGRINTIQLRLAEVAPDHAILVLLPK